MTDRPDYLDLPIEPPEGAESAVHRSAIPGTERCDFCNSEGPFETTFITDGFLMLSTVVFSDEGSAARTDDVSIGGWLACAPCAQLVVKDDREGLIERYRQNAGWEGGQSAEAEVALRGVQWKFWSNYHGRSKPWLELKVED